jgi:hypothetical protein
MEKLSQKWSAVLKNYGIKKEFYEEVAYIAEYFTYDKNQNSNLLETNDSKYLPISIKLLSFIDISDILIIPMGKIEKRKMKLYSLSDDNKMKKSFSISFPSLYYKNQIFIEKMEILLLKEISNYINKKICKNCFYITMVLSI